jgi:hypothetical protein
LRVQQQTIFQALYHRLIGSFQNIGGNAYCRPALTTIT